jgi:hypothetical protein
MLAVRVWPGMFSVDEVKVQESQATYRLVNVPFYLVGQLDKILQRLL